MCVPDGKILQYGELRIIASRNNYRSSPCDISVLYSGCRLLRGGSGGYQGDL